MKYHPPTKFLITKESKIELRKGNSAERTQRRSYERSESKSLKKGEDKSKRNSRKSLSSSTISRERRPILKSGSVKKEMSID